MPASRPTQYTCFIDAWVRRRRVGNYEEEPHPTSIHHAIESAWNEIRPADLPATTWNALERRERAFLMVVSLARRMNGGSVPKKDVEDIMKSANTPGWTQLFVPDGDRYRPKTPAE